MLTIVLTYRNKNLKIVKKCLDSLQIQTNNDFQVKLVDYGSEKEFSTKLFKLVNQYSFIKLIYCPVQGQLWNKSRAINIALKETNTKYFLVGDIDLLFHIDFIKKATALASNHKITYFQYGFLSKEESLVYKGFDNYKIDFLGNNEVTGTSLFPTDELIKINGYDEFYHGWGAEDTDVHIRLKNMGCKINFYDEEILVKHQWHPKIYRSKESTNPFHSKLERINHAYMNITKQTKKIKVNIDEEWGKIPLQNEYKKLLNKPTYTIIIEPIDIKIFSLVAQLENFKNELISIQIFKGSPKKIKKQFLKKLFKKTHLQYVNMEIVNNRLLEGIILNYKNHPYSYAFNRKLGTINLKMLF